MRAADPIEPTMPSDPRSFRTEVLRKAARIERSRRRTRAAAWALGFVVVAVSVTALLRHPVARTAAPGAATDVLQVRAFRPPATRTPYAVATGADGAVWVTEDPAAPGAPAAIVRLDGDGDTTTYVLPTGARPAGITAGADGALWYVDPGRGVLGRITTAGVQRTWPTPAPPGPSIAVDANGSLWFTEPTRDSIGHMTLGGTISQLPLPHGAIPGIVAEGPDGTVWLSETNAGMVAQVEATGALSDFPLPAAQRVTALTTGPGPAIWLAASDGTRNWVGYLDGDGRIVEQPAGAAEIDALSLAADGQLWFAGPTSASLASALTSGVAIHRLAGDVHPDSITGLPDGSLWIVDRQQSVIDATTATG